MIVRDSKITARQAADQFAAVYDNGESRKVCNASRVNESDGSMTFGFVRGRLRYQVVCLPDYSGWEITPIDTL